MEPEIAMAAVAAAPHADMSIWGLVAQADAVVKSVMLMLVVASLVSWGIIFDKLFLFYRIKGHMKRFERAFWSGQPLDDLLRRLEGRADHPAARIFVAAMREWKQCRQDNFTPEFTQERVDSVIGLVYNREIEQIESRLGFLATVGSAGPFIGLFGTVWGIMNSFTAIANSQNTSLTVVAPGIAEALFATAIGLVAAIPAVMAYNKLSSDVSKISSHIEAFSEEFSGILSKQTARTTVENKKAA